MTTLDAGSDLDALRSDQVGSLLRPTTLREAYHAHDDGKLDDAGLREAQDAAIREAVAEQEARGLGVVTDGEFRRLNFQDSFGAAVSGYDAERATASFLEQRVAGGTGGQRWDPGYTGKGPAVVHRRPVVARLALAHNLPLEEYRFLRGVATRPAKVTLIGPDRILQRFDYEGSRGVYADVDAFAADVVAVQRQMVGELVEAGCRYVQIDEPGYTAYVDGPSLEAMRGRGEDPLENLQRSIAADNQVIASFPGVTFGVHLCRGNQRSMWHREGSYDDIAELVFNGLAHQRLLLEYDSERAGGFEPLRHVPKDKVVVLGLVSTKTSQLEDADTLKRRIDEASRHLPLEQLAISPQCGFASDLVGNEITPDAQWRKLELVAQVAADVWG
jgi:5-methyltetrahydropteroyltriglutamate--homocysteine methyltransferase